MAPVNLVLGCEKDRRCGTRLFFFQGQLSGQTPFLCLFSHVSIYVCVHIYISKHIYSCAYLLHLRLCAHLRLCVHLLHLHLCAH